MRLVRFNNSYYICRYPPPSAWEICEAYVKLIKEEEVAEYLLKMRCSPVEVQQILAHDEYMKEKNLDDSDVRHKEMIDRIQREEFQKTLLSNMNNFQK